MENVKDKLPITSQWDAAEKPGETIPAEDGDHKTNVGEERTLAKYLQYCNIVFKSPTI